MKILLSILTGIAVFILVFSLTGNLINWITSGIESVDLRGIMRVILWIFGFTWTTVIASFLAYMAGSIVNIILTGSTKKKRWYR